MERDPLPHSAMNASRSGEVPLQNPALAFVASLRPDQWTKNLIVFAGLIFGQLLLEPSAVATSAAAFVVFCGLSSSMCLINDVVDRAEDRQHPTKSQRPIAAGTISPEAALIGAACLGGTALGGAFLLGRPFGLVALAFVGLLGLYNQFLKHVVILDVFTIAAGFVLRAVAGAVVVAVPISQWLLVCTMLLALFLGLAKRRHELGLLGDEAPGPRRIQPQTTRSTDLDRGRCNGGELRLLHGGTGHRREVRHRSPHADDPVSGVRRLSLPLSRPPTRGGRKPGKDASPRPAAARVRDALGNSYSTHYL